MLKINETKNDCFGTSTSQFVVGGLLVKSSTISASWPTTYEASSFDAPPTNSPSFKMI